MTKENISKPLTTFIGGILDKLSYSSIGLILGLVISICAILFWILDPFEWEIIDKHIGFFESFYFSIITFTSLGYGDIAPTGIGRLIASFEVLAGLILVAVFVGKVASERQNAMLRLVYTGQQQRRIVEFEKEIYDLDEKLQSALDDHDHEKLFSLGHSTYRFLASIHNYLKFHCNNGDLASFGNSSSLKRLYQSLVQIEITSYDAIRTFGIKANSKTKFEQISFRINLIAESMTKFHSEEKLRSLLIEIQNINNSLNRWKELDENGNAEFIYRNVITSTLLQQIKAKLPSEPWERDLHKKIATDLAIQNKLAERCIIKLIEDGQYKIQKGQNDK